MGRDQLRVLVCAAASLALLIASTLVMDWYHLAHGTADDAARIAVDLRRVHSCNPAHVCTSGSLKQLPGMFPAMATVTLWMSLGFAGLVAVQAGIRLITGNAGAALTKLGYVFALTTISCVIGAAYMFGPETEEPSLTHLDGALHRTWAPLTSLVGLVLGFAAIYMASAPDSSDLTAEYKPISLAAAAALPGAAPRPVSSPFVAPRSASGPIAARSSSAPITASEYAATSSLVVRRPPTAPPPMLARRTLTGQMPAANTPSEPIAIRRTRTGQMPVVGHTPSGPIAVRRTLTGQMPVVGHTPTSPVRVTARSKTSSIPPIPEHLRHRLSYVAITAELTSGGLDARHEDGSSRLVLWRDVVGVVARKLPPAYDSALFVDIVSTAGSTLRIVPWTRLTGDPVDAVGGDDDRPRAIVERVLAMAPGAKLDPATRHFFETGEVVQLPDLETLRAHDARLA